MLELVFTYVCISDQTKNMQEQTLESSLVFSFEKAGRALIVIRSISPKEK
jgi:hypothetical protein